jgi:hypothetical protein
VSGALLANVIVAGALVLATGLVPVVVRWFRDRPATRTSARDRLLARNPTLNADASLRWSTTARRVRIGWATALAVAVALLIVADRPTPVAAGDGGS